MKKIILFTLLISNLTAFAATKVEVYYFHYTRRCTTCQTVEEVTKKSVAEYNKTNKSAIAFYSVNMDEKSSESAVKKCNADGQSLIVYSGKKRIDLTDKAFLNATSKPERLKTELFKAINQAL